MSTEQEAYEQGMRDELLAATDKVIALAEAVKGNIEYDQFLDNVNTALGPTSQDGVQLIAAILRALKRRAFAEPKPGSYAAIAAAPLIWWRIHDESGKAHGQTQALTADQAVRAWKAAYKRMFPGADIGDITALPIGPDALPDVDRLRAEWSPEEHERRQDAAEILAGNRVVLPVDKEHAVAMLRVATHYINTLEPSMVTVMKDVGASDEVVANLERQRLGTDTFYTVHADNERLYGGSSREAAVAVYKDHCDKVDKGAAPKPVHITMAINGMWNRRYTP